MGSPFTPNLRNLQSNGSLYLRTGWSLQLGPFQLRELVRGRASCQRARFPSHISTSRAGNLSRNLKGKMEGKAKEKKRSSSRPRTGVVRNVYGVLQTCKTSINHQEKWLAVCNAFFVSLWPASYSEQRQSNWDRRKNMNDHMTRVYSLLQSCVQSPFAGCSLPRSFARARERRIKKKGETAKRAQKISVRSTRAPRPPEKVRQISRKLSEILLTY